MVNMENQKPQTAITYMGHSTLYLESRGISIITDPVLSNRVTFLHRTAPPLSNHDYKNADVVLISHLHFDHLDFPSLRQLNGKQRYIVPRGAAPVLSKAGFGNLQEVEIDESVQIGDVTIRATYAQHTRSRFPGGPKADCIGFVIRGDHTVYYPGDTRLFPQMAEIAGDLDIAFLPVWGWGPSRGREHMGPKEAAQSLKLLRPRYAVPIHWGTYLPIGLYWLKPVFHFNPPYDFLIHAREIAPEVEVRILQPGEVINL